MIAWALAAALLAPPQPFVSPTYAVQQSGGGLGIWVEETVVLSGVARSARPGGKRRYWLVEQRRADFDLGQRTTKHRWIDGRTCPALSGVVDQLQAKLAAEDARLAAAERFGIRQMQIPTIPPFHTPSVTLTRLSDAEPLSLRDYEGPIAEWWRRSAQTLETCWRTEPPLVAGRPVKPTIAADAVRP